MTGFVWHAPGRSSTWADARDWATTAAIVLGFPAAVYQLNLQRRDVIKGEVERNKACDELLDRQLRELQQRETSRQREQAEAIDMTWGDLESEPCKSLVVVINGSRRPIRSISCVAAIGDTAKRFVPLYCAEMHPIDVPRDRWKLPERPPDFAGACGCPRCAGAAGLGSSSGCRGDPDYDVAVPDYDVAVVEFTDDASPVTSAGSAAWECSRLPSSCSASPEPGSSSAHGTSAWPRPWPR